MTLAYERVGTGSALVLLHGLGHRRQGWDAVRDKLTPYRDVISVDLPGHGQSPPLRTGGRPPVEVIAAQIAALLSDLGLSRPHLAGNSLGGTIALALAAEGRAASVTALSPAGFPGHDYQFYYDQVVFTLIRVAALGIGPLVPALSLSVAGRALLYGTMVTRPGRITPEQARGDAAGFASAGEAMRAVFAGPMRFTAPVPGDVPVTIAWGTSDRVLPASNVRVARRQLPQARFVPLPGCGHVPMTDDPDLVARILLAGSGTATLLPSFPDPPRAWAGGPELGHVATWPQAARIARRSASGKLPVTSQRRLRDDVTLSGPAEGTGRLVHPAIQPTVRAFGRCAFAPGAARLMAPGANGGART